MSLVIRAAGIDLRETYLGRLDSRFATQRGVVLAYTHQDVKIVSFHPPKTTIYISRISYNLIIITIPVGSNRSLLFEGCWVHDLSW